MINRVRAFISTVWIQLAFLTTVLVLRPSVFLEAHWWSVPLGVVAAHSVAKTVKLSLPMFSVTERLTKTAQRGAPSAIGKPDAYLSDALAGLSEEAFFRGLLQPLIGVVPTAILFGLAHGGWRRETIFWAFVAGVIGLVLGLWYMVTTDIWVPIIGHAMFNCAVTAAEKEDQSNV